MRGSWAWHRSKLLDRVIVIVIVIVIIIIIKLERAGERNGC